MHRSIYLVLLLMVPVWQLVAGDNPKSIRAVRASTPPKIDGILSDDVWKSAEPATEFTQRDPLEGQPATEQTEIRVLYDDNALYFGCMFFDSEPEKIVARLTRRDNEIETDRGSIRIDSYHDHQTAFEFSFNPAGVKVDILQYDDANREDASWDVVWELETKILPNGW
ncbi:MAG: carbohydrate binding family 9 domain-containing protein, partial [Ignavibacteriales bacterium]|nr:carbohydrate binding family 9 domain-containing protein [Ignavibacteriales bacterium]